MVEVFKMFPHLRSRKTETVGNSKKKKVELRSLFAEGFSEACHEFHLGMGYKTKRKK